MECKFRFNHTHADIFLELIDTLWNVNFAIIRYIFLLAGELIDTLWNVNSCQIC